MSKEILVTGADGYVMSSILDKPIFECLDMERPSHKEFDFTDLEQARKYVRGKKVVIHAGAYTNVSLAKKEFELARKINGQGTANIAKACEEFGAKMILISTDFIFPGRGKKSGPYAENSRRPESFTSIDLGSYGSTKLLAEILAEQNCSNLAIFRISYPFGNLNEKDYVCKSIQNVRLGRHIFDDQEVKPTYLPDLARALEKIIMKDCKGIYHVATSVYTTPFKIAEYVVNRLGLNLDVVRGSYDDYLKNSKAEVVPQ